MIDRPDTSISMDDTSTVDTTSHLDSRMGDSADATTTPGPDGHPPDPAVPPAAEVRASLASARQRNGLPVGEKTLTRDVKFVRTLHRRGIVTEEVLRDPATLREKIYSEFRAPSTRCIYCRTLQTYISCTAARWPPSVDITETLKALQAVIRDSNAEVTRVTATTNVTGTTAGGPDDNH